MREKVSSKMYVKSNSLLVLPNIKGSLAKFSTERHFPYLKFGVQANFLGSGHVGKVLVSLP
jgi:hypothetical protein